MKTDSLIKVKGYMGFMEYEYPSFYHSLKYIMIIKNGFIINHIRYYEKNRNE